MVEVPVTTLAKRNMRRNFFRVSHCETSKVVVMTMLFKRSDLSIQSTKAFWLQKAKFQRYFDVADVKKSVQVEAAKLLKHILIYYKTKMLSKPLRFKFDTKCLESS